MQSDVHPETISFTARHCYLIIFYGYGTKISLISRGQKGRLLSFLIKVGKILIRIYMQTLPLQNEMCVVYERTGPRHLNRGSVTLGRLK